MHDLRFALGTSKHTAISPKYSKNEDFQTTTHKEPHTVQGQHKHWSPSEIQTFQMLLSDWVLRQHVIFFCALKVWNINVNIFNLNLNVRLTLSRNYTIHDCTYIICAVQLVSIMV